MHRTPFNPYTWWVQPFWTEFNGETTYVGTDMPTSNFSSMQIQQSNGVWIWTDQGSYYDDTCPWPNRYARWPHPVNNQFAIQTYGSTGALNCT
jgi:hypothetical protein